MATYAFADGIYPAKAYGQRNKFRFVNTWAAGEDWEANFVSTLTGNFTLGKGNIAENTFLCAFKLRNRMYLGFGSNFALSDNGDVTGWEEQNPGAAVIPYLSQFGQQDTVIAFASMQGRLAVIGRQSIQIWTINADPAQFALEQALDNTGTQALNTVQSLGDLDVIYLADTGFRSLRAKESTLNAFVDDVGTPIDLTIRAALIGYTASNACGIFEPTTGQYWGFVNGTIYVLSRYKSSEISAWSTYKPQYQSTVTVATGPTYVSPGEAAYNTTIGQSYYWLKGTGETGFTMFGLTTLTDSGGFIATDTHGSALGTIGNAVTGTLYRTDNSFTPSKMVVYSGQVYIRASDNKIYRYGGSDNNSFDHCKKTVELPWMDLKSPTMTKYLQAVGAAIKGHWKVETSTDPTQTTFVACIDRGSQTAPSATGDSTFDKGRFGASGQGTHFKVKLTSWTDAAVKVCKLGLIYREGNTK